MAPKFPNPGTNHLLCLSEEEVGLLVDLCHAGAFSEHIASSAERRERVDAFMWQVQQSLLPAVQKRYGKKVLKRTGAPRVSMDSMTFPPHYE